MTALVAAVTATAISALFLFAVGGVAGAVLFDALVAAAGVVGIVLLAHMLGPWRHGQRSRPNWHRRAEPALEEAGVPRLDRLETIVAFGARNAGYAHYQLRPVLRRIAAEHLSSHRGVDLDRQPAAARTALGEAAWELLRPDRPMPEDRHGPGLGFVAVSEIMTAIERLGAGAAGASRTPDSGGESGG